MSEPDHILIVEDEPITREQLVAYFEDEGYRVSSTGSGDEVQKIVENTDVILVLLDIKLPGKDGLTLTREIRAHSDIGIILVTSKQEQIDRILGLESGADDYVTKPFDPRELLSRARNLIRRVQIQQKQRKRNHMRTFDGWSLDLNKRELTTPEGQPIQLSAGEYQLLLAFMEQAGEVMNRDQLMNRIRNREWFPDDRYIDVLVGQLRKKLGERAANAKIIATIHGTGYLFTPEVV
ncbi:aruR [Symbiodinium necroappetens]|jgi:two-component system torCAD operon response regulator TorR|uniref:AruR protein n=1 Tax=Symbiodinium necroappetens TaxID=1628268 RepID=A0A812QDX7_9DINO|nr:aruR [Symbiodinium necroappetens]